MARESEWWSTYWHPRRVGLVDRDQRGARGEDAEAGVGPLGTAVGQIETCARLDAEVDEAERHLADAVPSSA